MGITMKIYALWHHVGSLEFAKREVFTSWKGLPQWLGSRESAYNAGAAGDVSLIPGLGRSPGGRYGNPLQSFCLENSMDRGAWCPTVHEVAELDTTEVI